MLKLENEFLELGLYYFKQFNPELKIEWILRQCLRLDYKKDNLDMLINLEDYLKRYL
jgi:hypothetical protein